MSKTWRTKQREAASESARVYRRWAGAVLAVALIATGCYFAVRALTPKVRDPGPEEIKAGMADGKLPLETAIQQINRLDVRDRREVMQSPEAQGYFQKLKPEQRIELVHKTLDRSIQDHIERYRKMNKEERAAFIEEVQERQREARERMANASDEERQQMREMLESSNMLAAVEKAVQTYLQVSSSEERAELAPLFDGALENLNLAKKL
ncbi:MAG: hypothetical protein NTW87_23815 [Planctomycetota bacterium]|nr:hypothetical protein [Planctomycetota bacterium]